ncbi:MAG: DNA alkylation repair protein [Bacteroidales bacterium]|nr:DNA alkylation repair protein [Bacteroidales bacterium]
MDAYPYYLKLDANLEAMAIEANSVPMKKYMKNHFEFYGIKSPQRRKVVSEFRKENGLIGEEEIAEFTHLCWDNPFRELHYSCMEIIQREKKPKPERIALYKWMIIHRSWWDSVDFIAPNLIGKLFQLYPEMISLQTQDFINSGNLWLQRSALIFQLKYREKTDLHLLFTYCEILAEHPDFFIRKAIGWSLRQAGKFFPNEVRDFVKKTKLSNLSVREAMKHLN